MTGCIRNAIYMARDLKSLLFPSQFADAMRSRDFDAAVGRAADALADAEEEIDSWEPQRQCPFCHDKYAEYRDHVCNPKSSVPVSTTGAGTEPTSKPVSHYPELPGAWGGDCEYCDTGTPHPGGPKDAEEDVAEPKTLTGYGCKAPSPFECIPCGDDLNIYPCTYTSASPADTSAVPHADTDPAGVETPPSGPVGSTPDLGEMFGVVHGALAVGAAIGAFDPSDRDTWKATAHELREFADVLDPPIKQKQ